MEQSIGICSINCAECEAYILTRNADAAGLEALAKKGSEGFRPLGKEGVMCDGCASKAGPFFVFCEECEARQCCRGGGHATSAEYDDFPCSKLEAIYEMCPEAKENLGRLR
ncbi:DUF3795 domain-containing protein [archaeon]|jgi:hypothetical protein|nr:MAG: DUF3795 domain-containing protein [archaeon]